MSPTCLVVCVGKDCRAAKGFDALLKAASQSPESMQVPCQDLCHGPIAGVRLRDEIRWFSRIRTAGRRSALVKAVDRGRVGHRLAEYEVRKRRTVVKHRNQLRPLRGRAA